MKFICSEAYESTWQGQPCLVVHGSPPARPKRMIDTLGDLSSADSELGEEIALGDAAIALPPPPFHVVIESGGSQMSVTPFDVKLYDMSWGALALLITLPSIDVSVRSLIHAQLFITSRSAVASL